MSYQPQRNFSVGGNGGGFTPEYDVRSGREIFECITRTGLNRLPVTRHLPRVLGKTADPGQPWSLADIGERLIVDGSILAVDRRAIAGFEASAAGLVLQAGIAAPSRHPISAVHVEQCKGATADGKEITRVYQRHVASDGVAAGPWWVADYTDYDGCAIRADEFDSAEVEIGEEDGGRGAATPDDEKRMLVWGPVEWPEEWVYVYPNGYGLLFWAQHILERIERIAASTEEQMSGANLALIVMGYLGDQAQARDALTSGPKVLFIPTKGASVARVGVTAVIDHLASEAANLTQLYYEATYLLDTSKGANTSGEAWSIRLEGMRYYVQQIQAGLKRVFLEVFNQPLAFANYQVSSAQSRLVETQILDAARLSQAISAEEYNAKVRELLPG